MLSTYPTVNGTGCSGNANSEARPTSSTGAIRQTSQQTTSATTIMLAMTDTSGCSIAVAIATVARGTIASARSARFSRCTPREPARDGTP